MSIKVGFSDTRRENEKLLKSHILSSLDIKETSKFHLYLPFNSPVVSLRTTRFNIQQFYMVITLCLCIVYGSQNRQRILLYTALTDWPYNRGGNCLLQGTDWFLIWSRLCLVFTRLKLNQSRENHSFPSEKTIIITTIARHNPYCTNIKLPLKKHSLKKLVTCIQIRNCTRNATFPSDIFIRVCGVCLKKI